MTISQLLERCELCGITLSARDGKLIATAMPGVVTPEAKAAIQAHKPALLLMLADDQAKPRSQPVEPATRSVPSTSVVTPDRGPRDVRRGDKWLPFHAPGITTAIQWEGCP
jgi:hypothetical protein